ncbi:PIN domain-containing protein [Scytonema sp. UIC 10036]|uniref:type II toxin-antitoxin system VapC family toxin n=1 Tax=Scytonema sp. UIC 10036 TaxID=2304196 RepID=UPI0012DADB34|nr:type II toxin-antitoxin system VapC family toxin [Scytonema sp. UIC 10036]MUG99497.1 PIN domain-containing protein [Scytonema sp. UIC 10036]
MSIQATSVLDASALLAYLQGEPGAKIVATALIQNSVISSINWAETLTKLAERGQDPDVVATQLTNQGLLNNALQIYTTDESLARSIAKLRVPTQPLGLSLGDRACLALALSLNLPALTCDRVWANLNIGVHITLIR